MEPNEEVVHSTNDHLSDEEQSASHQWWAVYALPLPEHQANGMRLAAVFFYEEDARSYANPETFYNAHITTFHLPLGHPMSIPYALPVPPTAESAPEGGAA